jgi:hypothetical protein
MKKISVVALISLFLFAVDLFAGWSEQLPMNFMRELSAEKLWTAEDDVKHSAMATEIEKVVQLLKTEKNIESIVNVLIDTNFVSSQNRFYVLKIRIFRFLLENPKDALNLGVSVEKLIKIEQAWKDRYLHTAAVMLRELNITDYSNIVDAFLAQVKAAHLKIYDLSPSNRARFNNEFGSAHGISLLNKKNDQYVVSGFYYEKQKIFALDFSRPLGETIITFAHEIVHAADPRLTGYRVEFEKLYEKVRAILTKLMGQAGENELITSMLKQVFFEIGRDELLARLQEQSLAMIGNMHKVTGVNGTRITAEDELVLRKWIQAVIGLSIENEYRAYGFSVLTYARFKSQLNIIQNSPSRENFIESIREGDRAFVNRLASGMNPFRANLSSYQNLVHQFGLANGDKLALDMGLNLLESIYIDELRTYILNLTNEFANSLKAIRSELAPQITHQESSKYFPDWTKPENINSPANPYSLITARVSTMWVIRVRENIISLVNELTEMRRSLLVLRAGILDFAELSDNEFALINLVEKNEMNPGDSLGGSHCSVPRNRNPNINYSKFQKYFGISNWNNSMVSSDQALPSGQLLEQLIKLKLIQGLAWLEQGFPDIKNNIIGAKVFAQKLREQLYDTEDLTPERAQQLQIELSEAIQYSTFSGDEVKKIDHLIFFLASAHQISFERSWSIAASEFSQRQTQMIRLLNSLGVEVNFDKSAFEKHWEKEMEDFEEQIEEYQDQCKDMPATLSSAMAAPIKIDGSPIRVSYVCSGRQIYLLRLPCGNSETLSIMTRNGSPRVRPIYNGRFVELVPYSTLHVR